MFYLDETTGKSAIYGGYFLGAGGGGSLQGGLSVLRDALNAGKIKVIEPDALADADTVLTASLVGSPSAGKAGVTAEDCRRAYQLFVESSGITPKALITNEAGAHSITNGWIAAAANGLPMIDSACNGRAHPTGAMGAMGLADEPGFVTMQSAVSGTGESYLELYTRGSIDLTSKAVRNASVLASGFVTVLRNPVSGAYIREHSAVGALSMCIGLGEIFLRHQGDAAAICEKLALEASATVIGTGKVKDFTLKQEGGFDVGGFIVEGENALEITFMNEYLTADAKDGRVCTFPDLIAVLDADTGLPVCSAELKNGLPVVVVSIRREKLLLGRAMAIQKLYTPLEQAVKKEIIRYVFP